MARQSKQTKKQAEATRTVPWGSISVVAVIAVAIAAIVLFDPEPPGIGFPSLGNLHIATVDEPHVPYNSSPPSSGPHLGGLAEWGVHDEPVPGELFVHNLEDGGIVFTYDCEEGCDELVSGLEEMVVGESHRLLTPYEGIEHDGQAFRAAAVAWTRVYYFDDLTEEARSALETFIGLYEGVNNHVGAN